MTSSPTATLINEPAMDSETSCWSVIQATDNLKGSFVYRDRFNNRLLVWDLSNFHGQWVENLPDDFVHSFGLEISTDGSTITSFPVNNNIFLVSQNQVKTYHLPTDKDFNGGVTYIRDGQILIPYAKDYAHKNKEDAGITEKYYMLNPVTGELTEHSVFLPNYLTNIHGTFALEYSPNMQYVIYLSGYENHIPQYTLFDLMKNEIIWTGPEAPSGMLADQASMPVWNPDSSSLTYDYINAEGFGNYYTIFLDGKLEKMTQI